MAKHDVGLSVSSTVPVGNVDVEIPVKADGAPLGRLKVSRGGVDWLPAGKSKSSHALTWEQLADLLVEHGKVKK